MKNSKNQVHSQSHTGFVLIKAGTKEESQVKWEWLTQRNMRPSEDIHLQTLHPRLSYSQKKRILSELKQQTSRPSSFKIKSGFALKQKKRAASTASCTFLKSDKKIQPFIYLNEKETQTVIPSINFGIDIELLAKQLEEARSRQCKLLGVISVRRMGLRFKLNHMFVQYSLNQKTSSEKDLRDLTEQIKQKWREFTLKNRQAYYYTCIGASINSYKEIETSQIKVVLIDRSPKLNFPSSLSLKIEELSKNMENILSHHEIILNIESPVKKRRETSEEEQEQYQYDHQKIKNVKEYVDKISISPEYKLRERKQRQKKLIKWYQEKYTESPQPPKKKDSDKNLLFESKSHYPQEIVDKKLLAYASDKVDGLSITNNKHKYMSQRLDLMMEQVKREDERENSAKNKKDSLFQSPITKKDMLWKLDKKNTLLSTQNIPYLIEKYGLNRFELYNLYNLYKSFQKIAVMRQLNNQNAQAISQKGIDRQTFEVGLKGLDMNPGQELIKGICYFGDFISWEHFIKIISISLRKTPEEKLTAILKGISSFDTGYLSRHQISLMIGNSLHKLFDHEEEELKEYFTNMAMAEFDPEGTGKVEVETMKEKVLGQSSQNMNMVSFLILNT